MPTSTPSNTFTPTATVFLSEMSTPTSTPLPPPTFTPSVTNTKEPTPTSTLLPTPDNHLGIYNDCIDVLYWTPYHGEGVPTDSSGCLQLSEWGFIAQNGGLYIIPPISSQSQQNAIYAPVSSNSEISFIIQIDKLRSSDHAANIRFGIVPANPITRDEGEFLAYLYKPTYPGRIFPSLWQDGKYGGPYSELMMSNAQNVVIMNQGNFMSISIDGRIVEKLVLRFEDRVFWIDFFLPANSDMSAFVSNFTIQEK